MNVDEAPVQSMDMTQAADLSLKRGRGRPRKNGESRSSNNPSFGLPSADESIDLSLKPRDSEQQDQEADPLVAPLPSNAPNTGDSSCSSRRKGKNDCQPTRLQPHRAARYTESYNNSDPPSPDIVVVTEEDARLNGHFNGYESDESDYENLEMPPLPKLIELSEEEWREREKKIQKLRDELRSEEMKLVLLKKLHQSQMIKENIVGTTGQLPTPQPVKIPSPVPRSGFISSGVSSSLMPTKYLSVTKSILQPQQQSQQSQPQSLQMQSQSHSLQSRNHSSHINSKISNATPVPGNPPVHLQSALRPGLSPISQTPVTTLPNAVMGYSVKNLQSSSSSSLNIPNHLQMPISQVSSSLSPQPSQNDRLDNQTPAQRQAAAKLALRKQLEKTLLQIPPPKPPAPEMHFIPNANNPEFICLLGLETVVDLLTDIDSSSKAPPSPFECVQCNTDFTPVWKWQEREGHGHKQTSVICENCVTSNIKKALKAEHTNRLKTAFVKALQQEQEIEQRMAQAVPSPPAPSTPPLYTSSSTPTTIVINTAASSPPTSHSPLSTTITRIGGSSSNIPTNSPNLLQQIPKLTVAHQSLLQAQAQHLHQLAQTQGLPQPAHMLPFPPLLATQYPYSILGKNPISSNDLQRQYLLDMIPSRSMPQGSLNWKT